MRYSLPDPRCRPHGQTSWEDLRNSGAGSSPLLGVLQALPDPRRLSPSQSTRQIPEAREQAARRPWMRCRHSGSSTSAARSEHQADLRSPGAGSSPLLGVLQALPDPRCRLPGQSTRQISGAQEQATRPSWVCCRPFRILSVGHVDRGAREPSGSSVSATWTEAPKSLPDLRRRQLGQSTRRIPGAQERAARPSWVC